MANSKLSFYIALCCVSFVAAKDCSIDLKTDFPTAEPVLLRSDNGVNFDLFRPDGVLTSIPEGTEFFLLCAGKGNKIESLGEDSVNLVCKKGQFQTKAGKSYNLKDLQCKSIPASNLLVTKESCGDGKGVIYKAGFVYGAKFATVFEVCYNPSTQDVYYTNNVINGKAIKNSISESKRRAFRADGMGLTTSYVNKLYKTQSEIAQFEKMYGPKQDYVSTKNIISRGHLSPDADFVFRYEQLATYFYCNVKPEFQAVNAGNWLRVEDMARKVAGDRQTDLEVYNGVLGHLELSASNGKFVKAFLDNKGLFQVPKYYFKLMADRKANAAIVMISVNDPFVKDTESVQFCSNVCAKAGLDHPTFTDASKGFTFCCELSEFLSAVKTSLPQNAKSFKKLLTA